MIFAIKSNTVNLKKYNENLEAGYIKTKEEKFISIIDNFNIIILDLLTRTNNLIPESQIEYYD